MHSILIVIFTLLATISRSCNNAAAFVPPQGAVATPPAAVSSYSQIDSRKYNFFENIGSMINNFGKKVTASHILIGPKTATAEEARKKLTEIKAAVNNDPEKFAQYAMEFSTCPSAKKGGDLGSFGPGMMVKNFDQCCFNEEVGVVHGPVSTQFGEHLIFIAERTGED